MLIERSVISPLFSIKCSIYSSAIMGLFCLRNKPIDTYKWSIFSCYMKDATKELYFFCVLTQSNFMVCVSNARTLLFRPPQFILFFVEISVTLMDISNFLDLVKRGWDAAPPKTTKDESLAQLPVVQQWISLAIQSKGPIGLRNSASNKNDVVLELGCGSGYPLAGHIAKAMENSPIRYHGIDLSEMQIAMAKEKYPNMIKNFEVAEMLSYCEKLEENSLCGIICLFALYHLPRIKHVEFFYHLKRALKKGAPLLFSLAANSFEGVEEDWLGDIKMYYSNFSPAWYELTLSELGFELLTKFKEDKAFLEDRESTWYMLFRVPDDNAVAFSFVPPSKT